MRPDTAAQLREAAKTADKYISRAEVVTGPADGRLALERAVRIVRRSLPEGGAKKFIRVEFDLIVEVLTRDHGLRL